LRLPLIPAVSGDECAVALMACGYHSLSCNDGELRVARHGQVLVIPRARLLDPDVLLALLEDAQLTRTRFIQALARARPR
jgi:hypothetical protein